MSRRKKRTKISSFRVILSSYAFRWYFLLTAIIILIFFLTNSHGTIQLIRLKMNREKLQQEKLRLEEETSRLMNQQDSLQNNPQAIEKLAREKYNMAKPGEEIYQVVPE